MTAVTAPRPGAPAPSYRIEGGADVWSDRRRVLRLVAQLTRRHLAARYRASALGFLWSLLHPLLLMAVYTVVFRFVLRIGEPDVPYPAFFLTGLLAWSYFRTAASNAATSVLDGAPLIRKARFPRYALPVAAVLSGALNYVVSLPLLLGFNLLFGVVPAADLLWLPLALVMLTALALGIGLVAAALTPFFRDLVQLMDVAFTAWFFATPVLYPIGLAAENLGGAAWLLYAANPMAGTTAVVHAAFLGTAAPAAAVALAAAGCVVAPGVGILVFRRLAPRFPEVI